MLKIFPILFVLFSCQSIKTTQTKNRLTEHELTYQKGLILFDSEKYEKAVPFFLKVTQDTSDQKDEIYNSSLWKLSLIYEKLSEFEKSVIVLLELQKRNPNDDLLFKIQLALAKNYLRLENKDIAFKIIKDITDTHYERILSADEVYGSLKESVNFNYDRLAVKELQFLGEIQFYFLFIMESDNTKLSAQCGGLLLNIYNRFFAAFEKDSLSAPFQKAIAIELLDQLRKFELYKVKDYSSRSQAVVKFSEYSNLKQKILTDRLNQ